MGIKVYYYMIAAVLGGGILFPQHGKRKKVYIALMAVLHTFLCGWRYMYLTGDLRKYAWGYYTITESGWFSEDVLNEGRNFGFYWLQKLFSTLTNGDFQVFLIFIAIVTELAVAVIVYRYSPAPWLSYLLWNCFGFYVFGFSAIKQALAMALVMLAFTGIMEEKPRRFLFWTLLAGCVHTPALVFLPAYWLAKSRLSIQKLIAYAVSAGLVFLFRNRIVVFISDFYYDETDFMASEHVGGRFLMIVALLIVGVILRGFSGKDFSKLFNLVFIAALIQMFSGFDNVFSRLADYYFQFLILYLPMMFYPETDEPLRGRRQIQHLALTHRQRTAALICAALLAGIYYHQLTLGQNITVESDNYLNYRFCWEVKDE